MLATDSLTASARARSRWSGSTRRPTRPAGCCPPTQLRKVVDWAASAAALLVSDECYLELAWDGEPVSVLHPDVCGGAYDGLLAVHSLSKRSNLAGYRCGLRRRRPGLVAELLAVRKNVGLMLPGPVQAAMVAALDDDAHVAEQHARYAARRDVLRPALEAAGFRIDHSEAGRSTCGRPAARTAGTPWLAGRAGHPGGARHLLRRRGRPARAGRPHRHRRAGRRRGAPAGRLTGPAVSASPRRRPRRFSSVWPVGAL